MRSHTTSGLPRRSDESVRIHAGVPCLRYLRPGAKGRPLVLFLPGGGHNARVAYGHFRSRREDSLDHWLEQAGFGLLALSYPSGPPLLEPVLAELSLTTWADCIADAALEAAKETTCPPTLIVLAWSLAGRVGGHLREALERRGVDIDAFVPLAASPPLPGLSSFNPATERFLPNGLWDIGGSPVRGLPREAAWLDELAALARALGREVIDVEIYRRHFRAATPVGLAGSGAAIPLAAFPIAAPLVPAQASDPGHAITDAAAWRFVNAQVVLKRFVEPVLASGRTLPSAAWERLLLLVDELGPTPSVRIDGGHLFFLGEPGAKAVAEALPRLVAWSRKVKADIGRLLSATTEAAAAPPVTLDARHLHSRNAKQ